MSAEMLAGYVGVAISLIFSFVPGVAPWYDTLERQWKQTLMGLLLVVAAAVIYGLTCLGLGGEFGWSLTCDRSGALAFMQVLLNALIANQGTYLITRK